MSAQRKPTFGAWLAAAFLAAACLAGTPGSAAASPPSGTTGLNLPVVLSLYDRVRSLAWHIDQVVEPADEATSTSSPSRLESLDTIVIDRRTFSLDRYTGSCFVACHG